MDVGIEGVVEGGLLVDRAGGGPGCRARDGPFPDAERGSPGWGIWYEPIGKTPLDDS